MNIAIIPARGGSKRIPRKNIKLFDGRPMIEWAIKKAKASNMFDHIIVSSDNAEIIEISNQCGAVTPFMRPAELANDLSPTVPVIAHAVGECDRMGWSANYFCCIYPGVPFMEANDLAKAFELLVTTNSDFVYPVAEYSHPTQRAMRQLDSGQMIFMDSTSEMKRTQDLEPTYHDAGQFYWGKASAWREHKKMHSDGIGMVIPNWRVVDIDNLDDWKRAELLSEVFKNQ
jgi:pseudaminic acid cytidylyltransferase